MTSLAKSKCRQPTSIPSCVFPGWRPTSPRPLLMAENRGNSPPRRVFSGVPLISRRKTFHGHREADNQAFGFPVVGKLTSELPCHEPAHERTSEPFMFRRPVEGWAAMLFPSQQKLILLHGPVDVDVASRRR